MTLCVIVPVRSGGVGKSRLVECFLGELVELAGGGGGEGGIGAHDGTRREREPALARRQHGGASPLRAHPQLGLQL